MLNQALPFDVAFAAPATFVVVALGYIFWWRLCESARYRKIIGSESAHGIAGQSLPRPAAALPVWLWPLGGHTLLMQNEKIAPQFERWAEELGGDYQLDAFGTKIVMVTELSEMRSILALRPSKFKRDFSTGNMVWAARELGLVPSLFFDEGKQWGKSRRLVSPSLAGHNITDMLPILAKISERLCEKLTEQADAGEVVDTKIAFNHLSHDVVCWGMLGLDVDSIRATKDRPCPSFETMSHFSKAFTYLILHPIRILGWMTLSSLLPWVRTAKTHSAGLRDFLQGAIDAARRDLKLKSGIVNPPTGNSNRDEDISQVAGKILRKMVNSTMDSGDRKGSERMAFTNEDIVSELHSLFIAGTETTSLTLCWAMYHLVKHPEAYARCRREALEVAPTSDGIITTGEQLLKLVFCAAVFKEVARLHPVVQFTFFHSTDKYTMRTGLEVEKGTTFGLLLRLAATSDENFTRAADFVPERWIDAEREEALLGKGAKEGQTAINHVPEAFLTFGSGPRVCPGKDLANSEGAMVLAMICAQFDASLAPGQADPPEQLYEILSGPKDVKLVFKKKE